MSPTARSGSARASDRWLRTIAAVAIADVLLLAVAYARVGLAAALVWYLAPPAIALAAAVLLASALVRFWRARGPARRSLGEGGLPDRRQLLGLGLLALVVVSLGMFRTYPSSYDRRPSQVRFRLPLDGPVTVAWGGPSTEVNYHVVMPDQRWAYDLLVTEDGRSFRGDGSRLEDHFAFGKPVRAPADGVVRTIHDGEPDGPIGQWRVLGAAGNHIVLQVAEREFLFIAHLERGSIAVRPGDRVVAGQAIARVGNSGNSSEPHVHLHLQDTPTSFLGEGIPLYFHGYRLRGTLVARGMPAGGQERRPRGAPAVFLGDVVEHEDGTDVPPAARRSGSG
jgi:hypothetical protein